MNYRHAYHAGNHADVLKHVVLLALLDALQRKPAPLRVFDTHGGRGRYDLAGEHAQKTTEAATGIARLRADDPALPDAVARYLAQIAASRGDANHYPGSPLLLRSALREHDGLTCCELHPEEYAALRALLGSDARVQLHQRDGYEALKALFPPQEKRALVLIDPPFERQLTEFDFALPAIETVLRRMPAAVVALWFPIKESRTLRPIMRQAAALPARTVAVASLRIQADDSPLRLVGSGLLICNPPWQIETRLEPALHFLAKRLGDPGAQGEWHWLKAEEQLP